MGLVAELIYRVKWLNKTVRGYGLSTMANKESGRVTLSLVEFPPSSGKDGSLVLESGCAEAIGQPPLYRCILHWTKTSLFWVCNMLAVHID